MNLKFKTTPRHTSAGCWTMIDRNAYVCGNVMVRNFGDEKPGGERWWIFVKVPTDDAGHWTWQRVTMKQRKWGYAHQGAAKIAARLMGNQFGKRKP